MNTNITPEDTIAMQKAFDTFKFATLSKENANGLAAVFSLITKLRDPLSGCQWDKKQTQATFAPCITEEAKEVVEAVQENNHHHLCEELGDLLFTTFFMIQLAESENKFTLQNVLDAVLKKLVFRHPHVFGATDRTNITPEEAFQLFQEAKKLEKNRELNS